MESRARGAAGADERTGHSVFDQPWWLDAVAPGSWDEVLVQDDSAIRARLPFVRRQAGGVVVLTQPPLTPTLGPWLAPQDGPYSRSLALEHRRMDALIAALPRFDLFRQHFSPAVVNWLPFHWAGFDARVRCTYRIHDLGDLDRVWAEIRPESRRYVRRAAEQLLVRTDLGLDAFLAVNDQTFARHGLRRPYSTALVRRIDAACAAHDARLLLFAVDADDRVHAAVYVVWDSRTAYLLMSGQDPEVRRSGGMSLLVWEALKRLSTRTQTFDFEGSMIQAIEQFYRHFGARQVPYLYVTGGNYKGRAADWLRSSVRTLRHRSRR
jgi:hypothetical protein